MAALQILAMELGKTFILYRQPTPDKAEFEVLVRMWADMLDGVSDAEFQAGIRAVMRESRFFPVPADVMRAVETARRSVPRAEPLEALPESTMTFDKRCEAGIAECAKILANMRGKMDGRKQGHRDTPLEVQLAGLRAMGIEQ